VRGLSSGARLLPVLRAAHPFLHLEAVQRLLAYERPGDEAHSVPEVGITPDQRESRIDLKAARAKAVAGLDEVTRAALEAAEERATKDAMPAPENVVSLASRRR
jgi:hypothetical protein